MAEFKTIWNSRRSTGRKLNIIRTRVLLLACEIWTLRRKDRHAGGVRSEVLQTNTKYTLATENYEREVDESEAQRIMESKLCLFEHICRVDEN